MNIFTPRVPETPMRRIAPTYLTAALFLSACATTPFAHMSGGGAGPGEEWLEYADPAEAGFDARELNAACEYADSVGSAAVMAVYRGHVIAACGAVASEFELHSVRKSLVSGLYGTAVARDEVDLDATLAELGIDDDAGLTAAERNATVADILAARSGVYLPASYAPSSQDRERPARGSHAAGTNWFYNNWDFNVAGVVFERVTGENLYEAFERRIAEPIGMEDWSPADGFLAYEPTESRHPAHTFRMSARDLARYGQLFLQEGRWAGRQVIPASWVERSTAPVSELGNGAGYAFMWWTYDDGALDPARYRALTGRRIYMARGTGSQALWVVPSLELVIVHRANTDRGRGIDGRDAWAIAERIAAAGLAGVGERGTAGEPAPGNLADARLVALDPTPFKTALPPWLPPEPRPISDALIEQLSGEYLLAPGAVVRVFRFQDQPYIHVPGEGDALLIPTPEDGAYTIRVVPGVRVEFLRNATGAVEAVELTLGQQVMRAPKQ